MPSIPCHYSPVSSHPWPRLGSSQGDHCKGGIHACYSRGIEKGPHEQVLRHKAEHTEVGAHVWRAALCDFGQVSLLTPLLDSLCRDRALVIPGWNSQVPICWFNSQKLVIIWCQPRSGLGNPKVLPFPGPFGLSCLKGVRSPMGSGLGSKLPRAQLTVGRNEVKSCSLGPAVGPTQ